MAAEPPSRPSLPDELVARGLVDTGLIDDLQLEAAAADETLVETLLDRRVLTQEELVALFHTQLGFPLVDDSYFAKLDRATLELIPRDLAVQHRVLPLYRADDKLFVAAVDPLAHDRLAEISYAAQHQIIVCVAKTFSVLRTLGERYAAPSLAKKKPKLKLEPLAESDAPERRPAAHTAGLDASDWGEAPASVTVDVPFEPTPVPAIALPLQGVGLLPLPQAAPPPMPRRPTPAPLESHAPAHAPTLSMSRPRVVEVQSNAPTLFETGIAAVSSPEEVRPAFHHEEYERFKAELANAPERDSVGRILSLFAARFFQRVVLLAHKQGMLLGWQTIGTDLPAARLRGLIVPLHLPSTFQQAVNAKTYQVGRLETNMINSAFLAALGGTNGGHSVVIPLLIDQKVAAVLYADTGGDPQPMADLSPLYRLCEDAGHALESLIRRMRR